MLSGADEGILVAAMSMFVHLMEHSDGSVCVSTAYVLITVCVIKYGEV